MDCNVAETMGRSIDNWKGEGLLAVAVCLWLACGVGCDDRQVDESAETTDVETTRASQSQQSAWEPGEAVDLQNPPADKRQSLELTEPTTYPTCRELLEEDGEPRPRLLPEREEPALALAGCEPEARVTEQGRRFIAYKLPDGDGNGEAGDLRLVVYGADGNLQWSGRMDRSSHADDFRALHRSSFIGLFLPQLVCVGTLWEGGTQVACFDADSGASKWSGELNFWSGIPLQAVGKGLHGADISGVTRRYPYSGAEMRRVDFADTGGHSALYTTDGRRLFFAANKKPPVRLAAYDFASMERIWRVEIPGHPDAGYDGYAFADHELGVLKIGETLHGYDATSGQLRWTLEVGDDRPPIVATRDRLYLLLRRTEEPTRLYALDPESGAIDWWGPVPTGTLHVEWVEGHLTVRSVRAVQRVKNAG